MNQAHLCPNSAFTVGNKILGVKDGDKTVRLGELTVITPEMYEDFAQFKETNSMFRMTGKCQRNNCSNWKNDHCNIPSILEKLGVEAVDEIPDCDIRQGCVWYAQEGESICRYCNQICNQ